MADDSHEVQLVEESLLLDEPIVIEEQPKEPEEEIPTVSSPVSALNFSSALSSHDEEHLNGESKIVVHGEEPEVSFEGQEDHSEAAPSSWRDGLTPRAVQMEAAHSEEIERLKSELEAAKAEVARLHLESQEKDATITKQQSQLDQLSKPPTVSTKQTTAKAASVKTPSKPNTTPVAPKPSPASKPTVAKQVVAKKPAATQTTSKPAVAAKPTATTAKITTTTTAVKPKVMAAKTTVAAKPKTPAAPPKPVSGGTAKHPGPGDAAARPPVRKLLTASPSSKPSVRGAATASPGPKPIAKTSTAKVSPAKASSAKPATTAPTNEHVVSAPSASPAAVEEASHAPPSVEAKDEVAHKEEEVRPVHKEEENGDVAV